MLREQREIVKRLFSISVKVHCRKAKKGSRTKLGIFVRLPFLLKRSRNRKNSYFNECETELSVASRLPLKVGKRQYVISGFSRLQSFSPPDYRTKADEIGVSVAIPNCNAAKPDVEP